MLGPFSGSRRTIGIVDDDMGAYDRMTILDIERDIEHDVGFAGVEAFYNMENRSAIESEQRKKQARTRGPAK